MMRIGELIVKAGVKAETVRFYERNGLLPQPVREPSGYRFYDDDSLKRLRFIRGAQELGFTLRQVRELMEMRVGPGCTCGDVKGRIEEQLLEVNSKLRDLQNMKRAMQTLIEHCEEDRLVGDCPIVTELDQRGARLLRNFSGTT